MAYANLGFSYGNEGESVLSAENTTKAWQLRNRASERERYFIDFLYDGQVTGNLGKGVPDPRNVVSDVSSRRGSANSPGSVSRRHRSVHRPI